MHHNLIQQSVIQEKAEEAKDQKIAEVKDLYEMVENENIHFCFSVILR